MDNEKLISVLQEIEQKVDKLSENIAKKYKKSPKKNLSADDFKAVEKNGNISDNAESNEIADKNAEIVSVANPDTERKENNLTGAENCKVEDNVEKAGNCDSEPVENNTTEEDIATELQSDTKDKEVAADAIPDNDAKSERGERDKSKKPKISVIIISIIVALAVIAAAVFGIRSCVNGSSPDHLFEISKKSVSEIVITAEIKDKGTKVYGYASKTTINADDTCDIERTIETLNSSFELVPKTESENIALDRNKLFNINLDKTLLNDLKKEGGVFSFTVAKENLAKVLGSDGLKADKGVFEIITYKNLVKTMTINFMTDSEKNVEITLNCNY